MSQIKQSVIALFTMSFLAAATSVSAATVWDSGSFTFEKPDNTPTTVRDVIIPGVVEITRNATGGIYNAAVESSYGFNVSPADTEWAFSGLYGNGAVSLANYENLIYTDWRNATRSTPNATDNVNPPGTVGLDAVMHIISADIYIGITFESWSVGQFGGGGFSYTRTTGPSVVPVPAAVWLFGSGLLGLIGVARRQAKR